MTECFINIPQKPMTQDLISPCKLPVFTSTNKQDKSISIHTDTDEQRSCKTAAICDQPAGFCLNDGFRWLKVVVFLSLSTEKSLTLCTFV